VCFCNACTSWPSTCCQTGQLTCRITSCRAQYNGVYEFNFTLQGNQCVMSFTSVAGHLMELDFPVSHKGWRSCSPVELFSAPVVKAVPQVGFRHPALPRMTAPGKAPPIPHVHAAVYQVHQQADYHVPAGRKRAQSQENLSPAVEGYTLIFPYTPGAPSGAWLMHG